MSHSRGFKICLPLLVAWVTRLQPHQRVNYRGAWQDDGTAPPRAENTEHFHCLRFNLTAAVRSDRWPDWNLEAELRSD